MKFQFLLFILVLLLLSNCTDKVLEDELIIGCPTEETVKSKESALALLIGKWEWIKTFYVSELSNDYVETSYSSGKQILFEFKPDRLVITENSVATEETYEILSSEMNTFTAGEELKIKFFKATGELRDSSILRISISGQCLTLVNSYNNTGADLNFQKIN
ncbi:MAG: hypothetical protein O9262_06140, partial [Cyclobacteriaceae bacterium]|nr:hypothetical protein [Cyclobacteriaceae bacterium]